MAVRCVLFDQTLSGPPTSADAALAALRGAGFTVRVVDCPFGDDVIEKTRAWIVAEVTMQSPPSVDDQAALMTRAAGATNRYGFTLRQHGITWSWTEGGA